MINFLFRIVLGFTLLISHVSFAQNQLRTGNFYDFGGNQVITNLIEVPYRQFSKTSSSFGKVLLDTGNQNMLYNGEFEAMPFAANWTASGGTKASVSGGTNAINGQAMSWDPSAGSQTLTSDLTDIPPGIRDENLEFTCWFKNSDADYDLRILDISNTVLYTFDVPNTGSQWRNLSFKFAGQSKASLKVQLLSGSNAAANIMDVCELKRYNFASSSNRVFARAYRSASLSGINPNGSNVKINIDTDAYDPYNLFNTSTNRFEIPFNGTCNFNAAIAITSTNVLNNVYAANIYANGTTVVANGEYNIVPATTGFRRTVTVNSVRVTPGSYYELRLLGVGNNSSSTLTADVGEASTWFSVDCTQDGQTAMSLNTLPSMTNTIDCPPGFATNLTNTTVLCKYRKNGDRAKIDFRITASGTPGAASPVTFTLPTGWAMDTAKMNGVSQGVKLDGSCQMLDNGTNFLGTMMPVYGTGNTQVQFYYNTSGNIQGNVSNGGPFSWAISDYLKCDIDVPVVGWSAPAVDMPLVTNSQTTSNVLPVTTEYWNGSSSCTTGTCAFSWKSPNFTGCSFVSTGRYTCSWLSTAFSSPPVCKITTGAQSVTVGTSPSYVTLPTLTGTEFIVVSTGNSIGNQVFSVECSAPR